MAPLGARKKIALETAGNRPSFICTPLNWIVAAVAFTVLILTFTLSSQLVRTQNAEMGFVDVSLNEVALAEFIDLNEKSRNEPLSIAVLSTYYQLIGPASILDVLETDPFCHDRGHNLGRVVFNNCKNLGTSIRICRNRCTGACYHGALMQYFQDIKSDSANGQNFSDADIRPYFSALCSQQNNAFTDYFSLKYWWNEEKADSPKVIEEMYGIGDCYHSLGHAVMYVSEYDVERAMLNCNSLDHRLGAYYCATGAYHEYFLARKKPEGSPVLFPCDISNYFPAACYRVCMNSDYQGYFFNVTYDQLVAMCRSMRDPYQRRGCFHGFGSNIWFSDLLSEHWTISGLCSLATDRVEERMCIDGVAGGIDQYYEEDIKYQLCSSLIEDAELFDGCMAAEGMEGFNRDPNIYYVTGAIGNATVSSP